MAIRKQNRCPACGNVVDLTSMVYSAASQTFVCPACLRAGTRRPVEQPPVAVAPPVVASTATPATTPSFEDDPLAALRSMGTPTTAVDAPPAMETTDATGAAATTASASSDLITHTRRLPARKPLPSWALPASALAVAALLITALAIVFVSRAKPAADLRRAWEDDNRERIIALKTQAEELTIARNLPAAHAKYRELETLVGGQQIGDPRLFDLVDQARVDQSRVYRMILHGMNPAAVDAGPLPSAAEASQASQAANVAPAKTANMSPPAAQRPNTARAPSTQRASAAAAAVAPSAAPVPSTPESQPAAGLP